jgi:xanthine dehydrogenase accessory factor
LLQRSRTKLPSTGNPPDQPDRLHTAQFAASGDAHSESIDLRVLRQLHQWRQQGQRTLLATVIRTWGSSPLPAGSIMALCETGAAIGSVSAGCIEDNLMYRYRRAEGTCGAGTHDIPDRPPERVK